MNKVIQKIVESAYRDEEQKVRDKIEHRVDRVGIDLIEKSEKRRNEVVNSVCVTDDGIER